LNVSRIVCNSVSNMHWCGEISFWCRSVCNRWVGEANMRAGTVSRGVRFMLNSPQVMSDSRLVMNYRGQVSIMVCNRVMLFLDVAVTVGQWYEMQVTVVMLRFLLELTIK